MNNNVLVFIGAIIFSLWGSAIIVNRLSQKIDDKFLDFQSNTKALYHILNDRMASLEYSLKYDRLFINPLRDFGQTYSKKVDPYICRYCKQPIIVGDRFCDHCGAPIKNYHNSVAESYFKDGGVSVRAMAGSDLDSLIKKDFEVWSGR